jgi:hypothetical protein
VKQLFTLFAASILLSAAPASAQTTFHIGVRAGLNRALTTEDAAANYSQTQGTTSATYSASKSAIYAWQAGVVAAISFGKISLQPALLFSQKGEKQRLISDLKSTNYYYNSYTEETVTSRSNWLELPLNVVYTQHGDHGWQVLGGAYVALALGGRQTGTRYNTSSGVRGPYTDPIDQKMLYGSQYNNRRFDAGLNAGLGYRQGPWQMQATYSLGLVNLHHPSDTNIIVEYPQFYRNFDTDAAYTRVAQLTGTYFFAL